MDVLKCVNCPFPRAGLLGKEFACTVDGNVIDLTNLFLVSPKDLENVTCSQNLDAVIRECQIKITQMNGAIELAMNLQTEREGKK